MHLFVIKFNNKLRFIDTKSLRMDVESNKPSYFETLPQNVWSNILDRLTLEDIFTSTRLVSQSLNHESHSILKTRDRIAIVFNGTTKLMKQCFDQNHAIHEKDILKLKKSLSESHLLLKTLGSLMSSVKIVNLRYIIKGDRNLDDVTHVFPNVICLQDDNVNFRKLPTKVFPNIKHLSIGSGKELCKFVPFLHALYFTCPSVGYFEKLPETCKRIVMPEIWLDWDILPSCLQFLQIQILILGGYQRRFKPFFSGLKVLSTRVFYGEERFEQFLDFLRDHRLVIDRLELETDSFSSQQVHKLVAEVSLVRHICLKISNRFDNDFRMKDMNENFTWNAENLSFQITLYSLGSVAPLVSCIENLLKSTISSVISVSLKSDASFNRDFVTEVGEAMIRCRLKDLVVKIEFRDEHRKNVCILESSGLYAKFSELDFTSLGNHLEIRVKNDKACTLLTK